ncbi:hypothetical protein CYLTODRAFT_82865 [Cylindrobasidium torrendii FP15055 ss-10]|uniref:Uncharacterized protein n=1 Tax=Cylindrobasidium torrendii FP15055 ss-10 TaxID=1314674 RepID=A0A0D7B321_9AGAR|nr:hypothetical protein CYLTODRAFT_82865 [Cylindrobasidium torrendii FP15055 ss-10]
MGYRCAAGLQCLSPKLTRALGGSTARNFRLGGCSGTSTRGLCLQSFCGRQHRHSSSTTKSTAFRRANTYTKNYDVCVQRTWHALWVWGGAENGRLREGRGVCEPDGQSVLFKIPFSIIPKLKLLPRSGNVFTDFPGGGRPLSSALWIGWSSK